MSVEPVIAFGQQPCGIFPKRFLVSKFRTARALQAKIGGRIIFFYHDSDHDPRETRTILHHRTTGAEATLNFDFENKLQRRFSPLHLKRIPAGWTEKMKRQLPAYVDRAWVDAFAGIDAPNVADFCLGMYRAMGLLEGIQVVRSSDPGVRRAACAIDDFFVDVPYEGEVVRARFNNGVLQLHEGGDRFIDLPPCAFSREQVSPTRDTRLKWMQTVLRCTHYVAGAGEKDYLHREDAPEITYIDRDPIERSHEAYIDLPA